MDARTAEGTTNIVVALSRAVRRGALWVRVRVPHATGWVPRDDARRLRRRRHAPDRRPPPPHRDAAARGPPGVPRPRRDRPRGRADARRDVLRPRPADPLREPDLRPDRVRDERDVADADRLARGRLRRDPRHRPARTCSPAASPTAASACATPTSSASPGSCPSAPPSPFADRPSTIRRLPRPRGRHRRQPGVQGLRGRGLERQRRGLRRPHRKITAHVAGPLLDAAGVAPARPCSTSAAATATCARRRPPAARSRPASTSPRAWSTRPATAHPDSRSASPTRRPCRSTTARSTPRARRVRRQPPAASRARRGGVGAGRRPRRARRRRDVGRSPSGWSSSACSTPRWTPRTSRAASPSRPARPPTASPTRASCARC